MDEKDTLCTFNELQTALHFLLWIWRNEISILQQALQLISKQQHSWQLPLLTNTQFLITH